MLVVREIRLFDKADKSQIPGVLLQPTRNELSGLLVNGHGVLLHVWSSGEGCKDSQDAEDSPSGE